MASKVPGEFVGADTLLGLQASDNSWLESLQISYGLFTSESLETAVDMP